MERRTKKKKTEKTPLAKQTIALYCASPKNIMYHWMLVIKLICNDRNHKRFKCPAKIRITLAIHSAGCGWRWWWAKGEMNERVGASEQERDFITGWPKQCFFIFNSDKNCCYPNPTDANQSGEIKNNWLTTANRNLRWVTLRISTFSFSFQHN